MPITASSLPTIKTLDHQLTIALHSDFADYHWIGETFLGAWRVWNNLAFRTGRTLPLVKRVGFTQLYDVADAPIEVLKSHKGTFNDKPGANVWFTEKFL